MSGICLSFSELHQYAEELGIRIRTVGCVYLVDLFGDVDKYTCSKLRRTIMDLMEQGMRQVVIGMENVDYIDSSGLGSLVDSLLNVNRRNGELAVSGASPRVRKALGVTGLSKIIPLFNSEADAISSFGFEDELPLAA